MPSNSIVFFLISFQMAIWLNFPLNALLSSAALFSLFSVNLILSIVFFISGYTAALKTKIFF